MAKRKRKQKTRQIVYKTRTYYPMVYCLEEKITIAVSHFKCKKKIKIHKIHFDSVNGVGCEFRKGYEFSLEGYKKGEGIYCPKCGGELDFRLWMSDTLPKIVKIEK